MLTDRYGNDFDVVVDDDVNRIGQTMAESFPLNLLANSWANVSASIWLWFWLWLWLWLDENVENGENDENVIASVGLLSHKSHIDFRFWFIFHKHQAILSASQNHSFPSSFIRRATHWFWNWLNHSSIHLLFMSFYVTKQTLKTTWLFGISRSHHWPIQNIKNVID